MSAVPITPPTAAPKKLKPGSAGGFWSDAWRRFRRKPRRSKHRRVYGQRWQIESGFSRNERLLGSALRARKWGNQKKEILMRVLTRNLMLLTAA